MPGFAARSKVIEPMTSITEIKNRIRIGDVWSALGGAPLRNGRGRAFWRDGDRYSVAVNSTRGTWHDFVSGKGGDSFELVRTVRGCGFREAAAWLADLTGITIAHEVRREADADWPTDLRWAGYWCHAVTALGEAALESLSSDAPDRRSLTALLSRISGAETVMVDEYRQWRRRDPVFTAAMAQAGQRSDARLQRRLANAIAELARGA
jgi:hypothetical protein